MALLLTNCDCNRCVSIARHLKASTILYILVMMKARWALVPIRGSTTAIGDQESKPDGLAVVCGNWLEVASQWLLLDRKTRVIEVHALR